MKKLKTQYTILILIAAYFLLNGSIPRNDEVLQAKTAYLINEGYTHAAAEHIAKVELKIIPSDAYYTALMED